MAVGQGKFGGPRGGAVRAWVGAVQGVAGGRDLGACGCKNRLSMRNEGTTMMGREKVTFCWLGDSAGLWAGAWWVEGQWWISCSVNNCW